MNEKLGEGISLIRKANIIESIKEAQEITKYKFNIKYQRGLVYVSVLVCLGHMLNF